jgi:Asp-tRNA(Asn)/Glu-tRNA(Gln) amidotransferase C subunit
LQPVNGELIKHVAVLAGLVVPDEDIDLLAGAVQNQIEAAEVLLVLELDDIEPIVSFDPRWR